jgi:hypothetical protein
MAADHVRLYEALVEQQGVEATFSRQRTGDLVR